MDSVRLKNPWCQWNCQWKYWQSSEK